MCKHVMLSTVWGGWMFRDAKPDHIIYIMCTVTYFSSVTLGSDFIMCCAWFSHRHLILLSQCKVVFMHPLPLSFFLCISVCSLSWYFSSSSHSHPRRAKKASCSTVPGGGWRCCGRCCFIIWLCVSTDCKWYSPCVFSHSSFCQWPLDGAFST